MIAIFTSVYTILRMIYVDGVKTLWHRLWPVIVTVVLGMLCAACMIVPYADIVLNVSTRVEGSLWHRLSQYLSLTYGMNYYKVLAGRIISDNTFGILGIDQKYYEFPQLSFSVLGAIVLPQAVWYGIIKDRNNVERRKWILRIVMLILMVAAVTVPMVGAIFNIGCESLVEGIPAMRFTYVLMPLMAVIYALFIDRCVERNDINRWLASAGVLFVILINYYAFRHYRLQYKWINIAIIVLNIAVIGIHYTTGKVRIMLGLLIAGVCFEGYVTNNVRYTYDRTTECINSTDFHGRDTTHILEYLKEHDDSFYRVEKTYHDFSATGDSLLQNYAPVSMYCSTMSGSLKTFYEKCIRQKNTGILNMTWTVRFMMMHLQSPIQNTFFHGQSLTGIILKKYMNMTGHMYIAICMQAQLQVCIMMGKKLTELRILSERRMHVLKEV